MTGFNIRSSHTFMYFTGYKMKISANIRSLSAMTLAVALISGSAILTGCSSTQSTEQNTWQEDGMIVLARPAPKIEQQSVYASKNKSHNVFGFLPSLEAGNKPWLLLSTSEKQLKLMQGKDLKLAVTIDTDAIDTSGLKGGVYQIIHKQRHPVWHASEEYFKARKLNAPAEGDSGRLLKGALGDFALFTDKELPIHSGPIQLPELGGLRLEEEDIARIYYHLEVGAQFIVQ